MLCYVAIYVTLFYFIIYNIYLYLCMPMPSLVPIPFDDITACANVVRERKEGSGK